MVKQSKSRAAFVITACMTAVLLPGCQARAPRQADPGEKRGSSQAAGRALDAALSRYAAMQMADISGESRALEMRAIVELVEMACTNDPAAPLTLSVQGRLALEQIPPDLEAAEASARRALENARNWPAAYLLLARVQRLRGDLSGAARTLDQGVNALQYLDLGGELEDTRPPGLLEPTPRERREILKEQLAQWDLWDADRRYDGGASRERAMRRVRAQIELERVRLAGGPHTPRELESVLVWDADHAEARAMQSILYYEARDYQSARNLIVPLLDANPRVRDRDLLFVSAASQVGLFLASGQSSDAAGAKLALDELLARHSSDAEAILLVCKLRLATALKQRDPREARAGLQRLANFDAADATPQQRDEAGQLRDHLRQAAEGRWSEAPPTLLREGETP